MGQIIVTNHCGESRWTEFKCHKSFQDVLCRHGYADKAVTSFDNQIQSSYYGGNISVSTEGISLEYFSALPQTEINSSTESFPRHAVFHYFLSDDSKQDAANTTANSNSLI